METPKKPAKEYIYNATAFVGRNGVGKTYKILKIVEKTTFKRVVIFNFSAEEKYAHFTQIETLQELRNLPPEGIFVYTPSKREAMEKPKKENGGISFRNLVFLAIMEDLSNSLIVLDDVRFFTNKTTSEAFKGIFVGMRQRKQNIFVTYHSIQDVQIDIYPHLSYMCLFNTSSRDFAHKEHTHIQAAKDLVAEKIAAGNENANVLIDLKK
jgi:hypothetical protein